METFMMILNTMVDIVYTTNMSALLGFRYTHGDATQQVNKIMFDCVVFGRVSIVYAGY